MVARIQYSLNKQTYTIRIRNKYRTLKTYVGSSLEELIPQLPADFLLKYELNYKVLQHARGKAKQDLSRKRKGITQGHKGYSKPGFVMGPKRKRKHSGISTEAYERAVHNLKWCEKMKHMGYNALPDYLECQETIAKYNGTVFDRKLCIEQYRDL